MKYSFKKKTIDTTNLVYFLSEIYDDEFKILEHLYFPDFRTSELKKIIDGIEKSKTQEKGEEYFWGNEDVRLYANKNGVFLIDDLGARAGETDPDKLYLVLSHDEMLQFLKDFKKFVEENA